MAEDKVSENERNVAGNPRPLSRRRFLLGSGAVVGGAVAATVSNVAMVPGKGEAAAETAALPSAPQTAVLPAPSVPKAIGYVAYDPAQCAGCRTCMAVCSLYHEGEVNMELSRIQVVAPTAKVFEAEGITCKQCEGPECLYACPTGALHVDAQTGARVIDQTKCIGCKRCIGACPQAPNAPIRFNAAIAKSLKCDLCGGDPQCVKFCPKSVSLTPHMYAEKDRVLKFVRTQEA